VTDAELFRSYLELSTLLVVGILLLFYWIIRRRQRLWY
jgi:hypothetical protein